MFDPLNISPLQILKVIATFGKTVSLCTYLKFLLQTERVLHTCIWENSDDQG